MKKIRIGIIGIGNMGSSHAQNLIDNKVPGALLTAICDINPERIKWAKDTIGDNVLLFEDATSMLTSKVIDAVIIATPHYDHSPLAIECFENGLHVLTEKPAGAYTRQVREMNEAASRSDKIFGIMYNQRTNPLYEKLRDLVQNGELGEIRRTNWIITNWYRSQKYYNSSDWRATWSGEGGGVLLNQDPHQLDLWQWICGMPIRVRAFCSFGKYHEIEVEDDVTAYVEYENGATGVFVTTTGEAPGTNRFEITGDNGKIVIEDDKLTFWRNRVMNGKLKMESDSPFAKPECWQCNVPINGENLQHIGIMRNWIDVILNGGKLLAPGEEGINGLTLSNAMLLSSWTDNWVNLPINEDLFYEKLQEKISTSSFKKENVVSQTFELKNTYK
ncbi:Gfo/Idh/MocA family protein [Clostridium lacusfryxellense]|uniref:Gfo/Idh/MocA family protein n=1 Tax=Clostridium lacusfryxellense TaxID=205328 RepID=UPI001C0B707D|nr:Gfo/Idh/MocA family oxidoreductase [Clostridium lacusfryxellense]MBU3113172.1 Gfo/Idh/MocA family oxidoreductase [Clostridium lacusfryxellense]